METNASQPPGSQPKGSSGTSRPPRATNPDKQISTIEKSVTHLLVATKQLLETLTQWSRGNAQEEEVSDVYVRLGYEFNLACRAFNSIGVETADLGPVPDLLRSILEDTLSQPASPQALDTYLPKIRDIIINLLHGLKRKQSKLRSKTSKDGSSKGAAVPPRQSSIAHADAAIVAQPDIQPGETITTRSESRQSSAPNNESGWSLTAQSESQQDKNTASLHRTSFKATPRRMPTSESQTSISAESPSIPTPTITFAESELPSLSESTPFPHPPPPPPKQDALTALQRGGDLERRASRRFSAYQISKHLGASPNGVPVLPPTQTTPVPNRGLELKESMSAVRSRTSYQNTRQKPPSRFAEVSPSRTGTGHNKDRISEERDEPAAHLKPELPRLEPTGSATAATYSPTVKTPDEFEGLASIAAVKAASTPGATLTEPLSPPPSDDAAITDLTLVEKHDPPIRDPAKAEGYRTINGQIMATHDSSHQAIPSHTTEVSPISGRELTLFLQYKSKIKKFVLAEGLEHLTMARLQLAFIEKFAWHTHNNGVDLPEIYIQDPVSGIRHELEDMSDVKDRSVLVLNVEVLDEVKKHFDEGIGGLRNTLEGVRVLLDGQNNMMLRFSDRQLETSKEMARLSAAPAPRAAPILASTSYRGASSESSIAELQNLRRDIAVLRQTYTTMSSDFASTMTDIRTKAEKVKTQASQAVAPSYEGNAGRAHINSGKKTLSTESESLVNRVDDLTDAVEDLRKDVVTRGVRPLPRQLEDISREIATTTKDLLRMKEFIKQEKPVWTKIWEQELDLVCSERDDLTQQEDLMKDLDGDLEDLTDVFKLVEEAMKQQNLDGKSGALRSASKPLDIDPTLDPHIAKDGMLGEVRALRPNHEGRLEAIERAEKARQKELESRKGDEFQREVANFVEEGKLRKTGGMEEVERLRKLRDERARKENFETQQKIEAEKARKRAEKAAQRAAQAEAQAKAQAAAEAQAVMEAQETQTQEHYAEAAAELEVAKEATASESHEHSQEVEAAFLDAPQGGSGSITPFEVAHEHLNPLEMNSAAAFEALHHSLAPAERTSSEDAEENRKSPAPYEPAADATIPTIDRPAAVVRSPIEAATTAARNSMSPPSATTNPDRQSWWKPAIFNP